MSEAVEKNVWEIISETLQENGIDVYPPGTKVGECKKEYVVLKQDGSTQVGSLSSEQDYYMFMLYVPRNKYSFLSTYEFQVKKVLDEKLYPMLMPTGQKMGDYYDDNYKAHMRAFLYRNNRRNKHL